MVTRGDLPQREGESISVIAGPRFEPATRGPVKNSMLSVLVACPCYELAEPPNFATARAPLAGWGP
jgi:hypothetical protein